MREQRAIRDPWQGTFFPTVSFCRGTHCPVFPASVIGPAPSVPLPRQGFSIPTLVSLTVQVPKENLAPTHPANPHTPSPAQSTDKYNYKGGDARRDLDLGFYNRALGTLGAVVSGQR